jgi:hypothetical protein
METDLFNNNVKLKINNKNIIKSISSNQIEIINSIISLYCKDGIELDPTYSKGKFYTDITEPKYKYDLFPKNSEIIQSSAECLPIENQSIKSIMFDPPFIADQRNENNKNSIMVDRFSSFKTIDMLWEWYYLCLVEFKRILIDKGILIFKCQDTVSSGKNYFSHLQIMNMALNIGYNPIDLFILTTENRVIGYNHHEQKHARKFHSYFMVFKNEESEVEYYI